MKLNVWKILFVLVIIILLFFPPYSKIQKLRQKDIALSQKLGLLEIENKRLSEEIEMLKSDPVYIEEVARQTLKVARKNEVVLQIINSEEE